MTNSNLIPLKQRIERVKKIISDLSDPDISIPELINSTNVLRAYDHLSKITDHQKTLISVYDQYAGELIKMVITNIRLEIKSLKKSLARKKLKTKQTKKRSQKQKTLRKKNIKTKRKKKRR